MSMKFDEPDQDGSLKPDLPAGASRDPASFFSKAYESFVPEILRKTVLLGLGGVSMTEDEVRRALTDLRLPRDEAKRVFDYLLEQSQKSKNDLVSMVGAEVKSFLRQLSLEDELRRALEGMRVKIQAEITFERQASGDPTPRVQLELRARGLEGAAPVDPAPPEGGPPRH